MFSVEKCPFYTEGPNGEIIKTDAVAVYHDDIDTTMFYTGAQLLFTSRGHIKGNNLGDAIAKLANGQGTQMKERDAEEFLDKLPNTSVAIPELCRECSKRAFGEVDALCRTCKSGRHFQEI